MSIEEAKQRFLADCAEWADSLIGNAATVALHDGSILYDGSEAWPTDGREIPEAQRKVGTAAWTLLREACEAFKVTKCAAAADVCACGTVKPPAHDSDWNALWHSGCAARAAMIAEADRLRFGPEALRKGLESIGAAEKP